MDPRKIFRFGESVGRDKLGEVFRAQDREGNQLAVKLFDAWTMEREDSRESYARGLAVMRAIKPRRTPAILGYRVRQDDAWLATQWVEAPTLAWKLIEHGTLEEQQAIRLACGILDALAELHSSEFAHGGISPTKILLTDELDPSGVVITDPFQHNLYSVADPLNSLQGESGRFIGLPEFFSPEQAQGATPDPRSDIYVIGLLIYKMLTGRTPFESGNPSIIIKRQIHEHPLPPRLVKPGLEISDEFEEIIQQSLSKEPGSRFETPQAMRAALASLLTSGTLDDAANASPLGAYPAFDAMNSGASGDEDIVDNGVSSDIESGRTDFEVAPNLSGDRTAGDQAQDDGIESADRPFGGTSDNGIELHGVEAASFGGSGSDDDGIQDDGIQAVAGTVTTGDGDDSITLEAIEDFAALAAEFDYGFDDEQTNSWFALGDDAEEMADRHGEEEPPPAKEADRRHNIAFYSSIPVILAALLIGGLAILLIGRLSNSEPDEPQAESESEESVDEAQAAVAEEAEEPVDEAEEADVEEDTAEEEAETDEPNQVAEEEQLTPEQIEALRQAQRERAAAAAAAATADNSGAGNGNGGGDDAIRVEVTNGGTGGAGDGNGQQVVVVQQANGGTSEELRAQAAAQRAAAEETEAAAAQRAAEEAAAAERLAQSQERASQARASLNAGNFEQALRLFGEALEINPGNGAAHDGLGDTYFRMSRYDRAVTHHRAAGQFRDLGIDYMRLLDMPNALRAFEQAKARGEPGVDRYIEIVQSRMGN